MPGICIQSLLFHCFLSLLKIYDYILPKGQARDFCRELDDVFLQTVVEVC